MKITSCRELYFQPVLFKTISFHHQSQYFLEFQLKYRQNSAENFISAYPSIVQTESEQGFSKTKIFRPDMENKVQSEKFLILFNDQSLILKGGCNFKVETDRYVQSKVQTGNKIQSQLMISLYRQHVEKDANQQIKVGRNGKIQKVGEETIRINFDVHKDYSEHSSFRHIVFTSDEYFSSLLFYIDFVHLGMKLRSSNQTRLDQFYQLPRQKCAKNLKTTKKQIQAKYDFSCLRSLLEFKELKKLYKLLIEDRLSQFFRVSQIYKSTILARINYMNNYEIQQPENLGSTSFINVQKKNLAQNLIHMQNDDIKDNEYFFSYYETFDIDQIYQKMFNDSVAINVNIKSLWDRLIKLKLKTLPEQFQTLALKFKIDRMTHITKSYAAIDESIYANQEQISQRLKNHVLERKRICKSSKFYNTNQLKHSMLTFHSQKVQSILSNSIQKNQSQILVILVHGYKGSQRDMAKIKSFISTFTSINFLPLETLNKQGNEDIDTLGKMGADEVIEYLNKKPYITSINVIGFSLGGIIAKSIMGNLEAHKQKFNLFLTLSSPHLGISELQNCLINMAVFWMKKVSKVNNIKQLCCEPLSKKSNEVTLISLSEREVLSWFNHIVLIGSNEDTFVPKYSALMAYKGDNKMIKKIQKNNVGKIKSLDRITVWFQYEQNCIQKLTGKKSHISFIQDDTFLEYIIIKYLQFF